MHLQKKKKDTENSGSVKSTTVTAKKKETQEVPVPAIINNAGKSGPYATGYKPIPRLEKVILSVNAYDRTIPAIRQYQNTHRDRYKAPREQAEQKTTTKLNNEIQTYNTSLKDLEKQENELTSKIAHASSQKERDTLSSQLDSVTKQRYALTSKKSEQKNEANKNELFKRNQTELISSLNDDSKKALEEYYRVSTEGIETATGYDRNKSYGFLATRNMKKQIEENAKSALKAQGIDDFDSAYEYYSMNRDKEKSQEKQKQISDDYDKSSTLGKIAKNVGTVINSTANGLQAIPELVKAYTGGYVNENAPLNIYSSGFEGINKSDTIRGKTREDISQNAGNTAATVYDIGMGIGDSVSAMTLGGFGKGAVLASQAASAATQSAKDATERGVSAKKAATTGITSGAIEAATEFLPLDNLFKTAKTAGKIGVKNALKNILKQSAIEASEESISELANTIADGAINGADSKYELTRQSALANGATWDEATKQANKYVIGNIGMSALGGAVSGGVMGAGATLLNRAMIPRLEKNNASTDTVNTVENQQNKTPMQEHYDNVEQLRNKDTQKGSITDAMSEDLGRYVRNDSDSTSYVNTVPTLQKNVNESSVTTVNPMSDIEIEQTKADLFKVTGDIKRDLRNTTNMYYKGENKKEVVSAVEKMIDDYAENPTDENLEMLFYAVNMVDNSMHGQKYTRKRNGVTSVYDNELSVLFNGNVDALCDKATKFSQRSVAESVSWNPTFTASVPPVNNSTTQSIPAGGEQNVSRYSGVSVPSKSDLPQEVKDIFVDNPQTYTVLKNADTKQKADYILASYAGDTNGAISEYRRLIDSKDPASIPLGYELSKQLIDSGDTDTAVDLIRDMSANLTKSGQFTQAAAITLMHNDPQAALRYAVKEIDSINAAGKQKFGNKWKDISLTDDEISMLNSAKKGDTEAIKAAYNQIGDRIAKEYPATKWEKFVELTKLGMLFNPRTHIRNVAANAILLPIRSASDRVSAVGMNVAHLINPNVKVTQSLTGSIGGKYKKAATDVWDLVKDGILGTDNKWDDLSGSVFNKQVFKDSKIGNAVKNGTVSILNSLGGEKLQKLASQLDDSLTGSFTENLRNFDYYLLSAVEDDPFVKKNFVNRLASYMKAQNITDAANVPDDAIALATQEALKATFKDDNMLTKMLSNVKKDTGKFGEVLLPFTKTPANLAMRSIDYSPVGIISTVNQIRKKADVSTVMDALSKNLVGTAGIAAGYILAKNGIIKGALSDDKDEAAFQKQQGILPYSINVHGNSYTYDWAQPASVPLIMGTVIYQSINESDAEERSALQKMANTSLTAGKAVANQWFELSPLQSLSDIFGGNGYGENDIAGNIGTEIAEMPQRLIPSLMSATANVNDTSQRTIFSNGDTVKTYADTVKSKIPVLRKSLPQAYDTWGNPKINADSTAQAAFNNYINPGKNGRDAKTDIDDKIQALYDKTGDATVFPQQMSWSVKIGDTTKKLSNVEYSDYQKNVGQTSYQFAKAYLASTANNTDDATQAENLNTLYNLSKAIYEQQTFGKQMSDSNAKYYEHYQNGGIDELMEYVDYRNVLSRCGLPDSDNMIAIWNQSGADGIQKYAERKEAFAGVGVEYSSNSKGNSVYDERGVSGLDMWNKIRSASLKTNESGSKSVDSQLLYNAVSNTNLSDEDKGYYIMNIAPKSDKLDKLYADFGYENVYRYYMYKYSADYDGNGSLKKDEITTYLNQQDMTNAERGYWYDILSGGNTKNPY
jgi:hypothetical protein